MGKAVADRKAAEKIRGYFRKSSSYEEWLLMCLADAETSAYLDKVSFVFSADELYGLMPGKRG